MTLYLVLLLTVGQSMLVTDGIRQIELPRDGNEIHSGDIVGEIDGHMELVYLGRGDGSFEPNFTDTALTWNWDEIEEAFKALGKQLMLQ